MNPTVFGQDAKRRLPQYRTPRNGHTYKEEVEAAKKGFPSAAEQLRDWQAKTSAPYGKDGYLYGGKTKKRKTKKRKTKKRKTKRRKN